MHLSELTLLVSFPSIGMEIGFSSLKDLEVHIMFPPEALIDRYCTF